MEQEKLAPVAIDADVPDKYLPGSEDAIQLGEYSLRLDRTMAALSHFQRIVSTTIKQPEVVGLEPGEELTDADFTACWLYAMTIDDARQQGAVMTPGQIKQLVPYTRFPELRREVQQLVAYMAPNDDGDR